MKVILTDDVKKVGKKGELVEVSDAYARNVLFRQNKAVEATKTSVNELEMKKKAEAKRKEEELQEAKALAERLKELSITVGIKTGDGGRVFGSVSTKEIAVEAKNQLKLELDKKKIHLPDPIKSLGTSIVQIKLHPQVNAELKVNVVSEK